MTSQRIQPKMLFQGAAEEEEEEPTTIVDAVVKELDLVTLTSEAELFAPLEAALTKDMKGPLMKDLQHLKEEIEQDAWRYKPVDELLGL